MVALRQSPVLDSSGQPFAVREVPARHQSIRARWDVAEQPASAEPYWGLTDSLSARAAANPFVRAVIKQRARVTVDNNCYAAAIIRAKTNYVVGSGATLRVLTKNREYNQAVESLFHEWAEYIGYWESLWLQVFSEYTDGEGFGVFKANYGAAFAHPVKLDYETVDSDLFTDPTWLYEDSDRADDGIVYDDFGNPIAYRKYKRHPGDGFIGQLEEPETLPAQAVVHLFRKFRGGQRRGVSQITPALMLHPILRRWTIATLNAAEGAARVNGFIPMAVVDSDDEGYSAGDTFELPPNAWLTVPEGAKPEQMKAEHPATTYPMLKQEVVAECARCLDMPYNIAGGDSSKHNFASGKLDHLPFRRSNTIAQAKLNRTACTPTFRQFMAAAVEVPGYLPAPPADVRGVPPHTWMWTGDEPIDPREAGANLVKLQTGQETPVSLQASLGRDADEFVASGARFFRCSEGEYLELLKRGIWGPDPSQVAEPSDESEPGDDQ